MTIVDSADVLAKDFISDPGSVAQLVPGKGRGDTRWGDDEETTDKGLVLRTAEGERKTLPADSIIMALPLEADDGVVESFKGSVPEIYQVGDSREFGYMHGAIADGAEVGRTI